MTSKSYSITYNIVQVPKCLPMSMNDLMNLNEYDEYDEKMKWQIPWPDNFDMVSRTFDLRHVNWFCCEVLSFVGP